MAVLVFCGHTMSHVSYESAPAADTFIGPVLFPDGTDRRASARIPLSSRVRIGPPGGLPTSLVSASDLSAGGLFIDADREVRVGARFSVDVPLEDGSRVYIAEAEVAYNRDRTSSSGFGVRFVGIDPDAERLIQQAIEKITGFTTDVIDRPRKNRRTQRPELSALPTIVPTPMTSVLPEPSIIDESVVLDATLDLSDEREPARPNRWATVSQRFGDTMHDWRLAIGERVRRAPRYAQGIAFIGAAALTLAVAITLWSGGNANAVEPADNDGPSVPTSTHQVLMGQAPIDALDAEPTAPELVEPTTKTKKVKLPPLVRLDEPEPAGKPQATKPAPAKAAKPVIAKAAPEVEAPPVKKPAPKKPEPKKAEAPAAKVSSAARLILGTSDDRVSIPLAPGARVLKTHVLKQPERYVIDVVDQPCPLTNVTPTGAVERIRSARHPEYCRIVMDLAQPLDAARYSVSGDTLVVTLTY
ncbi:MAG: PilZ domain-containing protein [Deltaproteobacteria bacterium]